MQQALRVIGLHAPTQPTVVSSGAMHAATASIEIFLIPIENRRPRSCDWAQDGGTNADPTARSLADCGGTNLLIGTYMDKGPPPRINRRIDNHSRVAVSQGLALQEMLGDVAAAAFLHKQKVAPVVIDVVLTRRDR